MSPFISYAQNYEDVVLWRALKHIEKGFYVDVGAQDPEVESVTRAFYERGWSGINIEPVDEYYTKLTETRPRDINLKVAVGRKVGLRTLHAFAGTGLSTLDSEICARHVAGGLTAKEIVVSVLTLGEILQDSTASTIHFLKIDVEGAEAEVLEATDLDRIRPWIIVIEATEPNLTITTDSKWAHFLTDRGYGFAYFDGLNRFYVANEVAELKEQLALPPNFFDSFVRASEWNYSQKATNLEQEVIGLRTQAQEKLQVQKLLDAARGEISDLQKALADLQKALAVEQAQRNYLSGRIYQLEAQLAAPSIDRAVGRLLRRMAEIIRPFMRANSTPKSGAEVLKGE